MDLVPLYDYAEKLGVTVCNFVLQNPATYWHAKDYDQDNHLLEKNATNRRDRSKNFKRTTRFIANKRESLFISATLFAELHNTG